MFDGKITWFMNSSLVKVVQLTPGNLGMTSADCGAGVLPFSAGASQSCSPAGLPEGDYLSLCYEI